MKIASISIESSFTRFKDITNMEIPGNKETNCVFIYGSNGTGKSSLSKLFYISSQLVDGQDCNQKLIQLKSKGATKDLSVRVCYDDENKTIFSGKTINNPIKIPVFNQDYIDSKITHQEDFKNNKFKENTLNYGVELKSKTDLNIKLKEQKEEQDKYNQLIEKINEKINKNIAQIKTDTSTTAQNKNYNSFTLDNFKNYNLDPKIDIRDLNTQRMEHIAYIQNLKDLNDTHKVLIDIDFLNALEDFSKRIEHINKSITFSEDKAKTQSAREILDKLESGKKQWKLDGVTYIENNICPFCNNDITNNEIVNMYKDYTESKLSRMEKYLQTETLTLKSYKEKVISILELAKVKAQYLDTIFQTDLFDSINVFYDSLIEIIDNCAKIISEKSVKENIYNDCTGIIVTIDLQKIEELNINYQTLKNKINDINKKLDNFTSDKTKRNDEYFKNIAYPLTFNEIKNELENIKEITVKISDINKQLPVLKAEYDKEVKDKNELLKSMNEILDDFNISNYRIDEDFDLCLNNEKVSFYVDKLLSNGEKSIIAFALFIAELRLYYSPKDKEIIFIDDPISSVDYPNLYGIYTYINNIIDENKTSQIFITSHNTLFLNLFKFDYSNKRASYFKLVDDNGKTKLLKDNDNLDSIYLEKLKQIYSIYKNNNIESNQKLYIHNYCRYVLETISRFEFPINDNESTSSKFYLNKIINDIVTNHDNYGISKVSLQALQKIINKGSHATINEVHDRENFEDIHYIKCCEAIIKFIHKKYNGQYELLSTDYDNINRLNNEQSDLTINIVEIEKVS